MVGSERGLTRREVVWVWLAGRRSLQTSQPFDKHAFNLALRRQVRLCLMCLPYIYSLPCMSALSLGHAVLGPPVPHVSALYVCLICLP